MALSTGYKTKLYNHLSTNVFTLKGYHEDFFLHKHNWFACLSQYRWKYEYKFRIDIGDLKFLFKEKRSEGGLLYLA